MRRLYFRIILGMLVMVVLSFFVPAILFRMDGRRGHGREPGQGPRPESPVMLSGSAEILKTRLENVPPAELDRQLDSLRRFFRFPIVLTDLADTTIPAEIRQRGDTGRMVSEEIAGGRERVYVPLKNTGKVLILGRMAEPRGPDTKSIIIVVALVLGIVSVSGFLIMAPLVRDLRRLENAASRFGQGDLNSRAEVKSRDAVGSVARRFNLMAAGIQGLIQRERQLLQSVSHELRTPIARIRFDLDMLQNAESPEEQRRRIEEIDAEVTEIDQLVGELLDYNRIHSESLSVERTPVAVREVLEEIIARLHDFRPDVEIDIPLETDPECRVTADRMLFRRAVQNLLANALRYARRRVVIRCSRGEAETTVEVCDDGPGVPPERREEIMMPFNRGQDGGMRSSGGVGLGLSIVRRIVELHGGTLTVGEADIGGACFATRWPDRNPRSTGDSGKGTGKAL
ncbi:MAG: HAMP domain-containing protein [candidate division Zixibacteria bacterium]|nr:HAMP domain-containing protein [candidate division Zixibacteria bacterium]